MASDEIIDKYILDEESGFVLGYSDEVGEFLNYTRTRRRRRVWKIAYFSVWLAFFLACPVVFFAALTSTSGLNFALALCLCFANIVFGVIGFVWFVKTRFQNYRAGIELRERAYMNGVGMFETRRLLNLLTRHGFVWAGETASSILWVDPLGSVRVAKRPSSTSRKQSYGTEKPAIMRETLTIPTAISTRVQSIEGMLYGMGNLYEEMTPSEQHRYELGKNELNDLVAEAGKNLILGGDPDNDTLATSLESLSHFVTSLQTELRGKSQAKLEVQNLFLESKKPKR